MADWDDEDFDVEAGFQPTPVIPLPVTDRWEGEDEEQDVKGSWEDDEDEKKENEDGNGKAIQVKKKKKKLDDILREKEEKKMQEMEARRTAEEDRLQKLSPEEELEAKARRQKLQEESDLQLAKEAFGVVDDGRVTIDSMNPETDEEFKEFGKLLKEKILKFEQSVYYVDLLEDLFQACSLDLEAEQVRKLGTSLTALAQEKTKVQKATAAKGKKKTKKAVLAGSGKSGRNADLDAYDMGDGGGGNDLDDFM